MRAGVRVSKFIYNLGNIDNPGEKAAVSYHKNKLI